MLAPFAGPERLRAPGRAGGQGPTANAGGYRPVPRLDDGPRPQQHGQRTTASGRQGLLRPAAARHEGQHECPADGPASANYYGRLCGWALARAHARTGRAAMISGYLGTSEHFDHAIADFAIAYADQNEHDYRRLLDAVSAARVLATVDRSECRHATGRDLGRGRRTGLRHPRHWDVRSRGARAGG